MSDLAVTEASYRVLRTLSITAMDGYTLQAEAQLESAGALARAVRALLARGWVTVVGSTSEHEIGRAFMHVPLQARGAVEEFLRNPRIAPDEKQTVKQ